MTELSALRIDGARLWQSLMDMAQIGATAKGGCNRQALTDEDRQGRDLFVAWCEQIGCSVSVDAIGNIFARRDGQDNSLPPILAGSHLDTQPTGGKFDGVYGVLAGLEVLRTLNDAKVVTDAPLEVAVWTNEEGSRYAPAMIGSAVWSGVLDIDKAYAAVDKAGKTLGSELERIGYRGDQPASSRSLKAAFEVHIEQGPILEQEERQIGVLSGIQGLRWYDLILDPVMQALHRWRRVVIRSWRPRQLSRPAISWPPHMDPGGVPPSVIFERNPARAIRCRSGW